ncbi:lysophospholipid acyltransferase family protein [Bdellovibrio sp. HCB185ZH]|uniref:lysophospholipid acyltransferase family protein n=1 Tax=Bdellovibrio sp. HCB185ZH TaxID=3394235 RepID=UPI0039A5B792
MPNTVSYRFHRIFWSIYFALTIGVIGILFGYLLTFAIYLVAVLFTPWQWASDRIRYAGEYVQCLAIRFLLKIQPWLRCETNLHDIVGFYDRYKTRRIIFVANHRSNLDTFLLISYIPGLRGLAKRSLFYNIFFAPFMVVAGFIPVEKGSPNSLMVGLKLLRDRLLLRNRSVLIFPETTRCDKGFPSVNKFGSAFFSLAIESRALVVPLSIQGTDQVMGRGDLFIHPFQPVKINLLPAVDASQYQDAVHLRDSVWGQVKAAL